MIKETILKYIEIYEGITNKIYYKIDSWKYLDETALVFFFLEWIFAFWWVGWI